MKRIDVQHHIVPVEYFERLASIGITESYGQPFPKWTPEKSLASMKKIGVDVAIMSLSTPGVDLKDAQFAKELARLCNEYMADIKQQYPDKFGGFAVLPLPYIEDSLEELEYALDELKLDGVGLLTNYKGQYLGDEAFDKLFDELNKRKVVVYIHPTDPVGAYDSKLEIPNSLIEGAFETTRAVTNLIYTGTTDRCPDIKYILAHGGGTIPFLAWRIALSKYSKKEIRPSIFRMINDILIKKSPETGLNILKNMYYDTGLTSSPYALKAMQEFVGPSRIVFGSDLPFSEKVVSMVEMIWKNMRDLQKNILNLWITRIVLNCFHNFRNENYAI